MAGEERLIATRITAWLFTHPRATELEIMQEFHLTYVEADRLIPQIHAIMDDLMAQYPDPKDFADQLLSWVHEQEGERHGG